MLKKNNEDLGKQHDESAMGAASNFELLKRDLEASQAELQESRATLDKEQALWQGKFTFLEQQYKQKEKELEDV